MNNESAEQAIDDMIEHLLLEMKDHKPNDRSEQDRYWAIAITEAEKVRAIWRMYVVADEGE